MPGCAADGEAKGLNVTPVCADRSVSDVVITATSAATKAARAHVVLTIGIRTRTSLRKARTLAERGQALRQFWDDADPSGCADEGAEKHEGCGRWLRHWCRARFGCRGGIQINRRER